MKNKLMAWLLMGILCFTSVAMAQSEAPATFSPQSIELEPFTFAIDYRWAVKEPSKDDAANGVLFQADSADGLQSLMVFTSGKGSYDDIYELLARTEYAGEGKREELQMYNNIEVNFLTNEETMSASAYFELDGVIYHFLLRNTQEKYEAKPMETLQGVMLSLMAKE
ncbi:MAG: hypothetical protein RR653_13200 [Clostridia bacterium]